MQFDGRYRWIKHIDFMLIDMLSLIISELIAFNIKYVENNLLNIKLYLSVLCLELLVFLFASICTSIYSKVVVRDFLTELKSSCLLALYSGLVVVIFFYILKLDEPYSREIFFTSFSIYICVSTILKQVYKYILKRTQFNFLSKSKKNLIVVSTKENLQGVIKNVIDGDHISNINIVKGFEIEESSVWDIYEYAVTNNVNEVLFACDPSIIDKEALIKFVDVNIGVHFSLNHILGFYPENTYISKVGLYHTLGFGLYSFSGKQLLYISFKRIFDIVISIIGIVFLLILMIIVKIANICIGDYGSLFYTQTRVGKNGKLFQLYKFRSMYTNADEMFDELLKTEKYKKEWDEYQKLKDDPRITKVGKVLRKTSLDEFPQFINILKGDMSLVGPRPLIPGELENHGGIKLYEQVKPGLTSWWAANGRSQINYEDRLDLEYYYVKNTSLLLDCKCIFKTLACILTRKGAE